MSKDLHFTKETEYCKVSKTKSSNLNLFALAHLSLYNASKVTKHKPESAPQWVQDKKIREATEKRARKAARGTK